MPKKQIHKKVCWLCVRESEISLSSQTAEILLYVSAVIPAEATRRFGQNRLLFWSKQAVVFVGVI